jgi:hypothetical protein
MRIFDNPHNLPEPIIQNRLQRLDAFGKAETYTIQKLGADQLPTGEIKAYIEIESTLTTEQIETLCNQSITAAELQTIERLRNARSEAALTTQLRTLTPQQAVNYIETNVTNLATAKDVLKIMARMLIAMRDKVFPDLPE